MTPVAATVAAVFFCIVLMVVVLAKNEMTYNARIRATDLLHRQSMKLINSGVYDHDLWVVYDSYPDYLDMFLDLTKWKFEQHFRGFDEKLKEAMK